MSRLLASGGDFYSERKSRKQRQSLERLFVRCSSTCTASIIESSYRYAPPGVVFAERDRRCCRRETRFQSRRGTHPHQERNCSGGRGRVDFAARQPLLSAETIVHTALYYASLYTATAICKEFVPLRAVKCRSYFLSCTSAHPWCCL